MGTVVRFGECEAHVTDREVLILARPFACGEEALLAWVAEHAPGHVVEWGLFDGDRDFLLLERAGRRARPLGSVLPANAT